MYHMQEILYNINSISQKREISNLRIPTCGPNLVYLPCILRFFFIAFINFTLTCDCLIPIFTSLLNWQEDWTHSKSQVNEWMNEQMNTYHPSYIWLPHFYFQGFFDYSTKQLHQLLWELKGKRMSIIFKILVTIIS